MRMMCRRCNGLGFVNWYGMLVPGQMSTPVRCETCKGTGYVRSPAPVQLELPL